MTRLLQTLTGNLPLLSTLMPLVGLFLIVASRRQGAPAVARMALTNAVLTLLLAIAGCALYPAAQLAEPADSTERPSTFQLVSARGLPLMPTDGMNVERWQLAIPGLLTGVDGSGAILLCLFCGLMLAAVLAAAREPCRHPALLYGLLLLWQSLTMLSLVSLDLRLSAAATAMSLPVLLLLAGLWGGPQRRQTVVWLIGMTGLGVILEFAAVLLLLDATVLLLGEVAHPVRVSSALLPERLHVLLQSSQSLSQWWAEVGNWAFPLIAAGAAVRLLLFPLHNVWLAIFRQLPRFLQIVLPGTLLTAGLQLLLRLLPLCGDSWPSASGGLLWIGLCSAGWMVLRASGTQRPGDRLALMVPAGGGLALATISLPAAGALTVAVLLIATVALAVGAAAACLVASPAERLRRGVAADGTAGSAGRHGLHPVTVPLWLAGLAVALPLAATATANGGELMDPREPGIWLLLVWACMVRHLAVVLWTDVAMPGPARQRAVEVQSGAVRAAHSPDPDDEFLEPSPAAARFRLAIAVPLFLLLAVLALAPSVLTDILHPAASRFRELTMLVHQTPE